MTDRNENYSDDESRLLTSPDEERAPVRGEHTAYFYNDNIKVITPFINDFKTAIETLINK